MAESKLQTFNHLKVHSQYSICEGAIKRRFKRISKENKINLWLFVTHPIYVEL